MNNKYYGVCTSKVNIRKTPYAIGDGHVRYKNKGLFNNKGSIKVNWRSVSIKKKKYENCSRSSIVDTNYNTI